MRIVEFLFFVLFSIPFIAIFSRLFYPSGEEISHLTSTVLPLYISNTLWLLLGVGFLTFVVGTVTAWLTTYYRFWGSEFLSWTLLLPLACPTYVIAFTYAGILDYPGVVQTSLRDWFGWSKEDYYFPHIRSLGGAVMVMGMVLYPYVYLLSRVAFRSLGGVMGVGRSMGLTPWKAFGYILLPSARPAIIAGISLACMETLADFGAVQHLAVDTFTTGIYRSWFGMFNELAATQLSAYLLFFVMVLVVLEYMSRKKAKYYDIGESRGAPIIQPLTGWKHPAATLVCFLPLAIGFVIPMVQLTLWAWESLSYKVVDHALLDASWNTLLASAVTAFITLVIALLLAVRLRQSISSFQRGFIGFCSLGYAIPGSILAVGILIGFSYISHLIQHYSGISILLHGTVFALIFAYSFRFLTIGLNTVSAGMQHVTPTMSYVMALSGVPTFSAIRHVYFPIVSKSMFAAGLLVFVETVKELPATLIIRPFDFNTLSIRTYELASDERLVDSSLPALVIVLVSIIPILFLHRIMMKSSLS